MNLIVLGNYLGILIMYVEKLDFNGLFSLLGRN